MKSPVDSLGMWADRIKGVAAIAECLGESADEAIDVQAVAFNICDQLRALEKEIRPAETAKATPQT